jgi:hypothetical protein
MSTRAGAKDGGSAAGIAACLGWRYGVKSFVSAAVSVAVVLALWPPARTPAFSLAADARAQQPATPANLAPLSDLDAFMAQVLERRSDAWRALHDYILSERESYELRGPGEMRLFGGRREYRWFVRDGYLIRSPLRFDGVAPDARAREDYENKWLQEEKEREKRHAEKEAKKAAAASETKDEASLVGQGFEPRFISEAYFMNFKFDPGNYYFAGRETLDGRQVLRIEYYPKKLYQDDDDRRRDTENAGQSRETKSVSVGATGDVRVETKHEAPRKQPPPSRSEQRQRERDKELKDYGDEIERKFNKVALITLWVDPSERQIVKYTFDNTELNFLPGRWLVRVGDVSVSMTMGQPIGKVWLPRLIEARASLTLANGDYDGRYSREFFDYREGEVKARIRSYSAVER